MSDYARDLKRILLDNGFRFLRPGKGDHEVWHDPATGRRVVVDRPACFKTPFAVCRDLILLPKAF